MEVDSSEFVFPFIYLFIFSYLGHHLPVEASVKAWDSALVIPLLFKPHAVVNSSGCYLIHLHSCGWCACFTNWARFSIHPVARVIYPASIFWNPYLAAPLSALVYTAPPLPALQLPWVITASCTLTSLYTVFHFLCFTHACLLYPDLYSFALDILFAGQLQTQRSFIPWFTPQIARLKSGAASGFPQGCRAFGPGITAFSRPAGEIESGAAGT